MAWVFAKLMMEGRVRAALRLIAEDNNDGPLKLHSRIGSETVRDVLSQKHPPKQPPKQSSIIMPDAPIAEPHPVLFDMINGLLIRSTVLRMTVLLVPQPLGNDCAPHLGQRPLICAMP